MSCRDDHELGKWGAVCDSLLNHDLTPNQAGRLVYEPNWLVWFMVLQTPLKGNAVPLYGVCRKPKNQLSGGEQLRFCCSAVLGCLVLKETRKTAAVQGRSCLLLLSCFVLSFAVPLNLKRTKEDGPKTAASRKGGSPEKGDLPPLLFWWLWWIIQEGVSFNLLPPPSKMAGSKTEKLNG